VEELAYVCNDISVFFDISLCCSCPDFRNIKRNAEHFCWNMSSRNQIQGNNNLRKARESAV